MLVRVVCSRSGAFTASPLPKGVTCFVQGIARARRRRCRRPDLRMGSPVEPGHLVQHRCGDRRRGVAGRLLAPGAGTRPARRPLAIGGRRRIGRRHLDYEIVPLVRGDEGFDDSTRLHEAVEPRWPVSGKDAPDLQWDPSDGDPSDGDPSASTGTGPGLAERFAEQPDDAGPSVRELFWGKG